eukprot:RCo028523
MCCMLLFLCCSLSVLFSWEFVKCVTVERPLRFPCAGVLQGVLCRPLWLLVQSRVFTFGVVRFLSPSSHCSPSLCTLSPLYSSCKCHFTFVELPGTILPQEKK